MRTAHQHDAARAGIQYHAEQCAEALHLAHVAEVEAGLSEGLADSLRKLAAYHSDHAFRWATSAAVSA